jgi:formylglycine-generating enzyme required for sulfatase activity
VHVAAVYDTTGGTNGQVRYYANGVKVGEANTDLTGGISSGYVSYIGSSSGTDKEQYTRISEFNNYTMNFNIQDFILQGGAMTDAEITTLGTVPFDPPTLTAAPSYLSGSISYTWTDISPATYQLYVAPGTLSASALKVSGNLQGGVTGTSHTFTGTAGTTYSAVVVATRGAQTVESTVVTVIAPSASRSPNLALNKPVTVNSGITVNSSHPAANAVDGNLTTRLAITGTTVPIYLDVAIDNNTGAALDVNEFTLKAFGNSTGDATGRIQKFNVEYWDGSAWQVAYSRTDTSQIPGSTDGSKSFSAVFQSGTVTTTKIRLNIISASAEPSIWEFELYWNPANVPAPPTAPLLTMTTALSGRGKLDYSWTIAQETAVQYTLYYKKGSFVDAASIISGGTAVPLSTAATSGSATLTGLDAGDTYSAVIAASRAGIAPVYSSVISAVSSDTLISVDNTLSSFSVSGGTGVLMRPAFNAQIVDYTLIVPYNYSGGAITLTAAANNANATLGAGQDSQTISLTGTGKYMVTVTAQDTTTKTYTLHVPKVYTVEGVEFKMNYVPGGSFEAGTPVYTVSQAYRMAETEVFNKLFTAVMSKYWDGTAWATDSTFISTGRNLDDFKPALTICRYIAIAFCNKLSLLLGKEPVYSVAQVTDWRTLQWSNIPLSSSTTAPSNNWTSITADWTKNGFRLPTEFEWSWAALGADMDNPGQTNTAGWYSPWAGATISGADANDYVVNSSNSTAYENVAGKLANQLGLYDMSGNQSEIVWDLNSTLPTSNTTDYRGGTSGNQVGKGCDRARAATYTTMSPGGRDTGNTQFWPRWGSVGFRFASND